MASLFRRARRGTVIIVVAGLAAMLAGLAVAFLMLVRQGADATDTLMRDAQTRLMLHAACAYVLEAGRLGYASDRAQALAPASTSAGSGFVLTADKRLVHREAFGWIDVREADGENFPDPALPGPRDQAGEVVYRADVWPAVGGTVICPMYCWQRPPYAIMPTVTPNPILVDANSRSDPAWGLPLQRQPVVQPVVRNGWPGTVTDARWADYVRGDARPVECTTGLAWFRVHRVSAATFIVTCGAGETYGFASWKEVRSPGTLAGAPGGPELFGNDRSQFEELRQRERRAFYEIRWSGSVRPLDFRHEESMHWGRWLQNAFGYRVYPVNGTQYSGWSRSNRFNPNPVGTISYIERLADDGDGPVDPSTGTAFPAW